LQAPSCQLKAAIDRPAACRGQKTNAVLDLLKRFLCERGSTFGSIRQHLFKITLFFNQRVVSLLKRSQSLDDYLGDGFFQVAIALARKSGFNCFF